MKISFQEMKKIGIFKQFFIDIEHMCANEKGQWDYFTLQHICGRCTARKKLAIVFMSRRNKKETIEAGL